MRRVVFTSTFDQDVEDVAVYIEMSFGEDVRHRFLADLMHVCTLLADFPGLGINHHDYATTSMGFVFGKSWIFFEYDDESIRFLHMIDGRRDKGSIGF